MDTIKLTLVTGVSGRNVYLDDERVWGGKPWGGGTVTGEWQLPIDEVKAIIKRVEERDE